MEGGVMQARAYQSLEPFDAAVTQLRDYFDRLVQDRSTWPAGRDWDDGDRLDRG